MTRTRDDENLKKRTTAARQARSKRANNAAANEEGHTPLTLETAIGARIRVTRQKAGLTAAELALQANLSPGMLSKIENGQISPSLTTLRQLASALRVPITLLFEEFEKARECSYVPAGQGVRIERQASKAGHVHELLGHALGGEVIVEPLKITLDKNSKPFPVYQREGQKFIHMLSGVIKYRYGDRVYTLNPGDSLYFNSASLHGPEMLVKLPATYLSVVIYPKV